MSIIGREGIGAILLAPVLTAALILTGCSRGSPSSPADSPGTAITVTGGYGGGMEQEEIYKGNKLLVITREDASRSWSYAVVVESGDGSRLPLVDSGEHRYASAEEAHRAGSSAAAAAIDRTRTTKGKP